MRVERVVLDSNVLISALLKPEGAAGLLLRRLAACNSVLLMSDATFVELATRLARPKFDRYRTAKQLHDFLDWLAELAEWVAPDMQIEACRDADDNRFLEVLIAGDGDLLISGDQDLLTLDPFEGKRILSIADALDVLG